MKIQADKRNRTFRSQSEVSIGWGADPLDVVDDVDWVAAPVLLGDGLDDGVDVDHVAFS